MPVLRWTCGAVVLFCMLCYVGLYLSTMKTSRIYLRKSRYWACSFFLPTLWSYTRCECCVPLVCLGLRSYADLNAYDGPFYSNYHYKVCLKMVLKCFIELKDSIVEVSVRMWNFVS